MKVDYELGVEGGFKVNVGLEANKQEVCPDLKKISLDDKKPEPQSAAEEGVPRVNKQGNFRPGFHQPYSYLKMELHHIQSFP